MTEWTDDQLNRIIANVKALQNETNNPKHPVLVESDKMLNLLERERNARDGGKAYMDNAIKIARILACFDGNLRQNIEDLMAHTPDGFGSFLPIQFFKMRGMSGGPHHIHDPTTHCIMCAMLIEANKPWKRLAAFLHDVGKAETQTFDTAGVPHFYGHERVGADIAQAWFESFGVDNWESAGVPVRLVVGLIREHMFDLLNVQERRMRKWYDEYGPEFVVTLLDLRVADWSAGRSNPRDLDLARKRRAQGLETLSKWVCADRRLAELRAAGKVPTRKDLAINGTDLIEAGMSPGELIGKALQNLQWAVNEGHVKNDRDSLLAETKKMLGI